ncbi:MAG TPA: DUF4407 domain-containing protein [Candidatus Competibacter sp.]|nr:DUF4407 domain-containing protein [Candidatus Competibacteraceae bacterium]HRW65326.1 DUF4407 domain-containing protein [Candidatus Competibacter sp.]
MNWFNKWLCRLGGYSSTEVEGSQDVGRILRIGMGVFVAAVFAALNWAVAGWTFSGGMDSSTRYVVIACCAIMGIVLVCVFDSSFVYFLDTKKPGVWGSIKAFGYAIIRVGLILMISSLTSQAIIPLLLKNELAGHALRMREEHEKSRNVNLTTQYNVAEKHSAVTATSTEIGEWRQALQTLPPNIQSHLANAEKCWQQYNAKRSVLIRQGLPRKKVRAQLQKEAQRCADLSKSARAERDDYLKHAQGQLAMAIQRKEKAMAALDQTKGLIDKKIETASAIEEASYTPTSAVVLRDLLETELGAKYKWAMVTGVLMAIELLFLLLKLQAGQTNIGKQIAANRLKQEWAIEQGIAQSRHDHTVWAMLNAASLRAAEVGIASPDVTQAFEQTLTQYLQTLAPLEACRATISTMGLNATEVERHQREYPQLAGLIGALWRSAIRKAAEILVTPASRPGQGGPFAWTPPPSSHSDQVRQAAEAAAG